MVIIFVVVESIALVLLILYIIHMKKKLKEWYVILCNIKNGSKEKVFTKGGGIITDLCYLINDIIMNFRSEISQMQKSVKMNEQIFTSMSHDVRTPLASLLGYLEAIHAKILTEEEEELYMNVAIQKAEDLKDFVNMLFEWSKLNSSEVSFQFETIDINEYTREIIIGWIPVLKIKKFELVADIPNEPFNVEIDKMAYSRVLNNLLQNAVNHSMGDTITIKICRQSDHTCIHVGNNGMVIPAEKLPYIFDRIYKCDESRSNKGSGLGLAIARELVYSMHGSITAQSNDACGTVFKIEFPSSK